VVLKIYINFDSIIVANTSRGGELFGPFVVIALSVANLFK
jgi:hypothetical protein